MNRVLAVVLVTCVAAPAAALAADRDPKRRIDPADQAKARSIVLKRSDLAAGWKRAPTSSGDSEPTCPGFNPDSSDLTLTGEADSDFEHPSRGTVTSSAEVFATTSDARKSWSRGATPALPRCLAHSFRESVEEDGSKVAILAQGRIAFPKVAPRSIAFRVVARVTIPRQGKAPVRVRYTMYIVGVGRGRADATLFTTGYGQGTPLGALRAFSRVLSLRLQKAGF